MDMVQEAVRIARAAVRPLGRGNALDAPTAAHRVSIDAARRPTQHRLPLQIPDDALVRQCQWLLLRAARGSARAVSDLDALRARLVDQAKTGDARACELLAAMCASGLGAVRDAQHAREWLVRAVELLEPHVRRPVPGKHGFLIAPTQSAASAYRPLYTSTGVLITDEIGTARFDAQGAACFDRRGRPEVIESLDTGNGPTRATPKAVAARIARDSTLEDFAWACRRTTPDFRRALLDARSIAYARMAYQRFRTRMPAVA
jgi:hypothetical protein